MAPSTLKRHLLEKEKLMQRCLSLIFGLLLAVIAMGTGSMPVVGLFSAAAAPTFDCTTVTEIPQTECRALVALYESANGVKWRDSSGWLDTNAPCNWHGVRCMGSYVASLALESNQLSGGIPPELGDLSNMTDLNLARNQLTGEIPSDLGNLSDLTHLSFNGNQLSGSIPSELGNPVNLIFLTLHDNQLSGPIPLEMSNLEKVDYFSYHNTDICVPNDAALQQWLDGIDSIRPSGFSCGQPPGRLTGRVIDADGAPLAGIQLDVINPVNDEVCLLAKIQTRSTFQAYPDIDGSDLYSSQNEEDRQSGLPASLNRINPIAATHTDDDGAYAVANLGEIPYILHLSDPTGRYADGYFDNAAFSGQATRITPTLGITVTVPTLVMHPPVQPTAVVDTAIGSVQHRPLTGAVVIAAPREATGDITITDTVVCRNGSTPSIAILQIAGGHSYHMTAVGNNRYTVTIPARDSIHRWMYITTDCDLPNEWRSVGSLHPYDPSGAIVDAISGRPVVGAMVTLYRVPGWYPKIGPVDDRPNTCESNLSKASGAAWSQPAPTDLGVMMVFDDYCFPPNVPHMETNSQGQYGWDLEDTGCWYVAVERPGYQKLISPVVGAPPAVADLDLILERNGPWQYVYLPILNK